MIDSSAVATVFSVYAAGVVIPGPNFVAVVHRAVSGRRSDTLALVAGFIWVRYSRNRGVRRGLNSLRAAERIRGAPVRVPPLPRFR